MRSLYTGVNLTVQIGRVLLTSWFEDNKIQAK